MRSGLNSTRAIIAVLVALAAGGDAPWARGAATPDSSLEYQVKAAYLYNFAKFIEWPKSDEGGPIVLGVLGKDPFGDILDSTIKGKTINGRPVVIKRFANVKQIKQCHILFISTSETPLLSSILPALGDLGVMTVGEVEGFLEAGGVVNFILVDNKVHFEINPAPVQRAGTRISSQLLKLGRNGK